MEKFTNPLHKKFPELQKSPEVQKSVKTHTRLTGEKISNNPEARLEVHVSRIEKIFLNKDEDTRKRNIEMLRDAIHDAYVIKPEDIPESYFELQKRVAHERGQHIEEIDEDTREQMVDVIIEDQKHSLNSWIDYLSSNDAMYPTWFKYFVWKNITKLSQFDKELGKFKERTKATTAPFPDIYREALAQISDIHERAQKDSSTLDEETEIFLSKKFPTQYAEAIQKTLEHSVEDGEQVEGKWVTYTQGDERAVTELYESLQGKGTGWCTAGHSTAEAQLESGDFHVFYSNDSAGNPTNPRLAIRMNGGEHIGEIRGILPHQEVEPLMQEVLDEKLKEFGFEANRYQKKSSDMKHLTAIEYATKDNIPLTRDDLRFLYELDTPIEGFGYEKDPRIKELKDKRNRKEDIILMCNCAPEYLATDFTDIHSNTQIFCEDTGTKITIFDFREEKNREKLPQLIELAQRLKESGSPAHPDMSFEGGIVSINIDPKTMEALTSWDTAQEAYKRADGGSASWIYDPLKNIPWTKPQSTSLDILILNHGETTPTQRDTLVATMNVADYRPLTLAELMALGITRPDLNKQNEYLVTYEEHTLGGGSRVPYLVWNGGLRNLNADIASDGWDEHDRFLFVRK